MRAQGPTFFLLNRAYLSNPKNALSVDNVSVGAAGLRLPENSQAGSPNSLQSSDGSMGGLVLPRGMAVDAANNAIYLLGSEPSITRFDARAAGFVRIPGIGGGGSGARQFDKPSNIAIAGGLLYVADTGNQRVQVFGLRTLALAYVWDWWDAADVCATTDAAYMLDSTRGRVYRHRPGTNEPVLLVDSPKDAGRWSRIMADSTGRTYLVDKINYGLSIFDASGAPAATVTSAEDVRDLFPEPLVRANYQGIFTLPGGLTFDLQGRPAVLDPAGPLGPKPYESDGIWIGQPLDSQVYNCQWHRIQLEADLPSGTRVVVSTYTDSAGDTDISGVNSGWQTRFAVVGPLQPLGSITVRTEFLIQSPTGQFLWPRVELEGDGYATPLVRLLRVHCPRESYLQYLPAVFSSDPEGYRFLDRFLAVFKTEWDNLERRNSEIARYFDPKAVPAGPSMDWLASWLSLSLEQTWSTNQKRTLLEAAPRLYPRLGTPGGLCDYLRAYIPNAAVAPAGSYPIVVENFRLRQQMVSLGTSALGRAGSGSPMWSSSTVERLQLGVSAQVGTARLISTGDPESDFFNRYAHRFQVLIPAAWVKTAADEAMVRRALDTAKPAHTTYELRLVEPRFQVGVQLTLGLDTILGEYPVVRVASAETGNEPPGRPPGNRLGYDTVLAPGPWADVGFRLPERGVRAGVDTFLR